MTNAALDRLERISSAPPVGLPERPEPDASFDEKLAYMVQTHMAVCDALIERREFERNVLEVLRDLVKQRSKR